MRPDAHPWPDRPDAVWLRLHARSFFTSLQVQGILFSRDTAMEGRRRALVVRRFEMEQFAADRWVLPDKWVEQMQQLFRLRLPADPSAPPEPPDAGPSWKRRAASTAPPRGRPTTPSPLRLSPECPPE